ncbi:MAG: hypothetical protein EON54_06690 [Alcaligenaceae bacterium]|nr:MAG: hypothetical protein EON54_06690 [Alcaligenaceae bacterium]
MQFTRNTVRKYGAKIMAAVAVPAFTIGSAFAQTAPADPEAGIAAALVTILAIIAVAGAGMIAVSVAGVGWNVGAKFIKRLGGKA